MVDSNITYSNKKTTWPIEIINPSLWIKIENKLRLAVPKSCLKQKKKHTKNNKINIPPMVKNVRQ